MFYYLKCLKCYRPYIHTCVETQYYDTSSIKSARVEALRMFKRNKCDIGDFVSIFKGNTLHGGIYGDVGQVGRLESNRADDTGYRWVPGGSIALYKLNSDGTIRRVRKAH